MYTPFFSSPTDIREMNNQVSSLIIMGVILGVALLGWCAVTIFKCADHFCPKTPKQKPLIPKP